MNMPVDIEGQATTLINNQIQVVAFQLGNEEYAVDILNVQEIVRMLNITRVPRSPAYIDGVVNLRGNIIPVVNLHKKFNMQISDNDEDTRIIVLQFDELKAGIIVDKVSEVLHLNLNDIEATANVYSSIDSETIKGVARVDDRLLIRLDLQKLLGIDNV